MTVITIVLSGKIIKYRDLHCNLTDQISSVFSVCIEQKLLGGSNIWRKVQYCLKVWAQ